MNRVVLPVLLAAVAVFATTPVGAEPRAVVELFTSQGCSSCPPADRLLGELARDPTLVAMSLPIDYWDYIGWKDTLAKPRHTVRQRFYARTRGDGDVYTPQVVINGVSHAVGNDKAARARAARHRPPLNPPPPGGAPVGKARVLERPRASVKRAGGCPRDRRC